MNDEFESLNDKVPDFNSVLLNRISSKSTESIKNSKGFDPYTTMLKKKEYESSPIDPSTIVKWPEKDVKILQDYCSKMGITYISSGKMHPIAFLALLKQKLGDNYTNVPLSERLPNGYEKISDNKYNINYTYEQTTKRQILHS